MKNRLIPMLLLAAFAVSCNDRSDIISENIENAKAQIAYLIEASEAGETLRIPSTYKNGEIEFVPTDDWVSGFFAGTLWYMYELTGDEYYAENNVANEEAIYLTNDSKVEISKNGGTAGTGRCRPGFLHQLHQRRRIGTEYVVGKG